ncbi:MAG: 7-carboxy-7-deazaguanine synthase QueE [Bacteroidales bacterium]|nr:7-carboxy-7-deazaguanine synthase QueE [Bacteroidales bacterium]
MDFDQKIFEGGRQIPLVEEFYTIQGEGFHTGKAAYFIRVGGCDVGCSWCDTKFSWNPALHPVVPVEQIVDHVMQYPAAAVVVTGGEPLMVNMEILTVMLKERGIETFLETSGAYALSGHWDWICLSPKKKAPPLEPIYTEADELKVIIASGDDISWALENAAKVGEECKLYLQPEWSRREEILPLIIDFSKQNPRWMISIQSHKYMHIP